MKISIIVPVYNVEPYLARCFDSIAAQTYPDIECIFVDDASPDDSFRILCDRIASYSGPFVFRILRHTSNKGLSEARNTGTLASTGKYVYYLDSDDAIPERSIEHLAAVALKYGDVDIVQGNTEVVSDSGDRVEAEFWSLTGKSFPEFSSSRQWIKARLLVRPRVPVNAWNKLIKRDLILENRLFFRPGIIHEDELWLFHVAKHVSTIGFVHAYTYIHYIVAGSIMQSGNAKRSATSWLLVLEEMLENIDDVCRSEQRRLILSQMKSNMRRLTGEAVCESLLKQYRNLLKRRLLVSARALDLPVFLFFGIYLLPSVVFRSSLVNGVSKRLIRMA